MIKSGIFLGEFGWELMKWQGHLRYLMQNERGIVHCQTGHSYLYKDFAKTVELEIKTEQERNKWWPYCNIPGMTIFPKGKNCGYRHLKQKFIQYGKKDKGLWCDVLLHNRSCKREFADQLTGDRTYDMDDWTKLILSLGKLRVAVVGTKEESGTLPWVTDHRDISLEDLANLMANSKLIIGPSSGIMHYASLCGLPHLVWTDQRRWNVGGIKTTNWNRYMKHWNPLGTKAVVVDTEGWHPSVETILRQIDKHKLL